MADSIRFEGTLHLNNPMVLSQAINLNALSRHYVNGVVIKEIKETSGNKYLGNFIGVLKKDDSITQSKMIINKIKHSLSPQSIFGTFTA